MSLVKQTDIIVGGGDPITVLLLEETTKETCSELNLAETVALYVEAELTYDASATFPAVIKIYGSTRSGIYSTESIYEFRMPFTPGASIIFGQSIPCTSHYLKATIQNPNAQDLTNCRIRTTRQLVV